MRRLWTGPLFAAILAMAFAMAFPPGSRAAVFGPEWIPPESALARDLRELAIRGWLPLHVWTLRPTTRREAARLLADVEIPFDRKGLSPVWMRATRELAGELEAIDARPLFAEVPPLVEIDLPKGRIRLRPYARVEGVWQDTEKPAFGNATRVGIRGTAHFSSRFSLHEDIFVGEVENGRNFADSIVNHTDVLVFAESMYAGYQSPFLSARLGRMRHGWGPSRYGDLFFSDSARPFDHFEYGLPLGKLRFHALTGVLQTAEQKNIAAHRLEWSPSSRFMLGVSEGAIFQGSPVQPLYLLGIVPYTIVERIQGSDVGDPGRASKVRNNVIWQFDALWRVRESSAIWGALLIDDVATETADMPSRLGFLAGGTATSRRPSGDWRLGFEAAKVYNYTYSVYYENSDWSHQDHPIGNPEGNDVESARVEFGLKRSVTWDYGLTLQWLRKGEGRVGKPWYPPGNPNEGENPTTPEWELSGVVERRLGAIFEVGYEPSAALSVRSRLLLEGIENRGHQPSPSAGAARFDVVLELHR